MGQSNKTPELIVEVPPNPKAVVILLGWFGSQLRHVQKYSQVYEKRGCATITGSLETRALMVMDSKKIDQFAIALAKEAAKLLRIGHENTPLVCHAFSNGGAIPLQRMEQIMDGKIRNGTDDEDWKLLRERLQLGAEIFDSAPAFPDMETFKGAVTAGLPNSPILAFLLFWLASLYFQVNNILGKLLQGQQDWGEAYWKHWENGAPPAPIQAYVYSTADTITKSWKIDELVQTRLDKGVQVKVKRFDDSLHVQHMMKHKAEYGAFLDDILKVTTQ